MLPTVFRFRNKEVQEVILQNDNETYYKDFRVGNTEWHSSDPKDAIFGPRDPPIYTSLF